MKKVIVVWCIIIYSTACGQSVKLDEEILISESISSPLTEPHFIVDPTNQNHFIVAAILTHSEDNLQESHIVLLQSWDNGKSWETKHFNENITFGGDPWLAMNKKGTLILSFLGRYSEKPRIDQLLVYVSEDSGENWNKIPVNLGPSHDRQSIMIDEQSQNFLIVSTKPNQNEDNQSLDGIVVSRLYSNGMLREINWHGISNIWKNVAPSILTKNGELLVPYVDYYHNGNFVKKRRHWMVKSRDFGRSFSAPYLLSEGGRYPYILLDTFEIDQPKIHHLKTNDLPDDEYGFSVKSSLDGGYSWGEEVDADHVDGKQSLIRNAQWTINNSGIIGIFWYDGREASKNSHNLFFTFSKDHAQSFHAPIKISKQESTPDMSSSVNNRWPTGGEYFGLSTTTNGNFHVVWVDYRNGTPQLFYNSVGIPNN